MNNTIEEIIQQKKPFRSPQHRAGINLMYTMGVFQEKVNSFFKAFELTPKQFNVLSILRGANSSLSTMQIRDRMISRMSDVSRLIDRMEAKELILKQVCPKDKRLVDIDISQKGLDKLKEIDGQLGYIDGLLGLSDNDSDKLNELLNKMR